jgi:hypothetical protein
MKLQNIPLSGSRPDLLAFNPNGNGFRFAIEAKGYSDGCRDMGTHKRQSEQGGIPVNFTVACVSFNLYRDIQCKYFDPYNDNIPFDDELFKLLTCSYYSGFSEFLDQNFTDQLNEIEYQGESFYEVPFTYRLLKNLIPNNFLFPGCFYCKLTESYKLRLLLPVKIREYAKDGLPRETKPFVFDAEKKESHYMYVDNDSIGLRIGG